MWSGADGFWRERREKKVRKKKSRHYMPAAKERERREREGERGRAREREGGRERERTCSRRKKEVMQLTFNLLAFQDRSKYSI